MTASSGVGAMSYAQKKENTHPESPKNQKGPRPRQDQARWLGSNPEGSHEVGLDSGGSASESPEITELTALEHFSSFLQKAQRNMAEGGKCAQVLRYTGKSERTQRRQKKALKDLQAKGFQTLPDFFRKKAEETEAKTKFEAMVAAAKTKIKALQNREEEEDSEAETETADKHNSELMSEPDTSWGSAPGDTPEGPKRRTLDSVATQHSKKTTSEPRHAEEIARDPSLGLPWVAESGGTVDGIEGGHAAEITDPRDPDTCSDLESPQYTVEEVEEDSDDSDKTGSNPSEGEQDQEQDSCKDAQAIVAQMLEDLRHGNVPNVGSHLHSTGSVLDVLQDRVALHKAKVELVAILKKRKSDDFVHSRILAMEALLNVYLDTDLDCTWTDASILVAKSQGHVLRSFWTSS
ncbi:hypothetical protein EDB89DRAFT_1908345 [Lactarius sanguifluus]|nr:hypothetical protein EDB89DRAFT_1908345 [Lactarius sanguifluus]